MGLDWNPGNKAKSGFEPEFLELWRKLHAKPCFFRSRKVKRFGEITVSAFETLHTPRVGFDAVADGWVRLKAFPSRVDKSLTEEVFVARMKGFRVLELVQPCDGIPTYSNGYAGGYVERYAFRGQFLKDCLDVIGDDLLETGYVSKLPQETIAYGARLLEKAEQFAASHSIKLSDVRSIDDEDSPIYKLDIVLSASRWCRFWGERGHWLEAYW